MATKQMRPERIFVTVTSVFDSTGYVHPREIIWEDGRVFKIESISTLSLKNTYAVESAPMIRAISSLI